MSELLLHSQTARHLDDFLNRPGQALLLTGPAGAGKYAIARHLAARLLAIEAEGLQAYPHYRHIAPQDGKAIGIETVRELEHFLSLKIPDTKAVARIAVIENAHLMTTEAQNALLKTLEEPPADTILVLTAAHEQALLPTIRSRLQNIAVKKPETEELLRYFGDKTSESDIRQAMAVSGGLPGLMGAMLEGDEAHPLMEAVEAARRLLQASPYERLLQVDVLAKRKDFCGDICFVLMQMAQTALAASGQKRWQQVLTGAYHAKEQLLQNAQPKLVLTNLMLSL